MTDSIPVPNRYLRSTSDYVAFWLLWVILLLPVMMLIMMVIDSGVSIVLLPLLAQLVIHGIALTWFLDRRKPSSKALLMLLGGTGLLYFLAFSGCVILIFTA